MAKIHFIAVGGSIMHQLAILMKQNGYEVSGSDDEITDPALTRLREHGIIEDAYQWNKARITPDLDAVIVGMHAKKENIELAKAIDLRLKIYSFPEYVYEQTKHKQRVIVAGSHGKTSTTAMIVHILLSTQKPFDYLLGGRLLGGGTSVFFERDTSLFIGEGDEYLASPLLPKPKFHFYKPHIAVLTGIAWDHINVFPTFEYYVEQFALFIDTLMPHGVLIYCAQDEVLKEVVQKSWRKDLTYIPYKEPLSFLSNSDRQMISIAGREQEVNFFGTHNMLNAQAAYEVCVRLGLDSSFIMKALGSFEGVEKRLQVLVRKPSFTIWRDFAHAPSKLKATIQAVKARFVSKRVIAVFELHTFSSLSASFLQEYQQSFTGVDTAVVYFSEHTLRLKGLPLLDKSLIQKRFASSEPTNLYVLSTPEELRLFLQKLDTHNSVLLLMSSGTFDGLDKEINLLF